MVSIDLLIEGLVFGVLVGCFYAAVSIGLSIAFGLLDVPHIAHASFLVLAAYMTFLLGSFGIDPLLAGALILIPFFFLGAAVYRFYYEAFEKRGTDAGVRGIAFFFGIAFIVQVVLSLVFVSTSKVSAHPISAAVSRLGKCEYPGA